MTLGKICFASLIALVSIVSPKVVNRPRFSDYHLPWACSVVHKRGHLISAGTIFDEDKVIVSVDNFNETVVGGTRKYYQVVADTVVYAGSNLMDPEKLKPWATPEYQARKGIILLIPTGREKGKFQYKSNANIKDLSRDSIEYDHYGAAYNIAFLVLDRPFDLNDYVRPVLLPLTRQIDKNTEKYIKDHETFSVLPKDSCITYSWSKGINHIRYHEVRYLLKTYCLDLFCNWNLSTCGMFPSQSYQTCFKSVTYVDVCPSARGAALFCPDFSKAVFGILTTAPSCGVRHMPGVYTTLPTVIEIYETMFNTKLDPVKRNRYDALRLNQPYSPFG